MTRLLRHHPKLTLLAVVLLASCATREDPTVTPAFAQDLTCNVGDVAWVSSAVNANVGLGSGSGRCNTATVAGAEYNNIATPWGIQAVFDCACAGVLIRILGDTGDYGSATASWNNRFDANKDVRSQISGGSDPIVVIGYADSSTSCEDSNAAAGCPVEMDFAGGASNGLNINNPNYEVRGLAIRNAALVGFLVNASSNAAGMEITDSGSWGIQTQGTTIPGAAIERSLISGTGGSVAGTGGVLIALPTTSNGGGSLMYSTVLDVTGDGVRTNGATASVYRNLIQNPSNDCVVLNHINTRVVGNTLRGCGGDGIDRPATSPSNNNWGAVVALNLIAECGGYGINAAREATRSANTLAYNVFSDNASGDINLALMPNDAWALVVGNVLGATVVFASATDSSVVSGAEITTEYPRGLTPLTFQAGVSVDELAGGGGGGGGSGPYTPVGAR